MLSSKFTNCLVSNHLIVSPSSRRSTLRRSFQENDYSEHESYNSERVSRDRLVALFKRIAVSISKSRNDNSLEASPDDSSVETSVVEFLYSSGREKVNNGEPGSNKQSPGRPPKKSKPTPISQLSSAEVTRPPSNFVKKSPIPSPSVSPSQNSKLEETDRETARLENHKDSPQNEEMKLNELKELAKERGIRGYSRLKKSELIEQLRSCTNV